MSEDKHNDLLETLEQMKKDIKKIEPVKESKSKKNEQKKIQNKNVTSRKTKQSKIEKKIEELEKHFILNNVLINKDYFETARANFEVLYKSNLKRYEKAGSNALLNILNQLKVFFDKFKNDLGNL